MLINRGMDQDVVPICNGILLSHKKEQNYAIYMNGPRDCHTELSNKLDPERQIWYCLYMVSEKKKKKEY